MEELARHLRYSLSSVAYVERGSRKPSEDFVLEVADLFAIPEDQLEAFTAWARGLPYSGTERGELPWLAPPSHIVRVFLCHASEDKLVVRDLYRRLRVAGFAPWLDEEDLLPGQDWRTEIPKAVRQSDVVLVCLSQKAITKSGYVQREIKFALDVADEQPENTIYLIPVRLEECEVPDRLQRWHWVDLYEERGYERLIRSLRERAKTKLIASNKLDQFQKQADAQVQQLQPKPFQQTKESPLTDLHQEDKGEVANEYHANYLIGLITELEQLQPEFSKYLTGKEAHDDAIVDQIEKGMVVTYRFLDAASNIIRHRDRYDIEEIFRYFGDLLRLTMDPVARASSPSNKQDNDGYKFLTYEMFVGFVALLIKRGHWDVLGTKLSELFYVRRKPDKSGYFPFTAINQGIASLDEERNRRLFSAERRVSIVADMLKDRFTNSKLAGLISWERFMEADHFLFVRTTVQADNMPTQDQVWCPKTGVYFQYTPDYILRAQSKAFLDVVAGAANVSFGEIFLERIKRNYVHTALYCPSFRVPSRTDYTVLFGNSLDSMGTLP